MGLSEKTAQIASYTLRYSNSTITIKLLINQCLLYNFIYLVKKHDFFAAFDVKVKYTLNSVIVLEAYCSPELQWKLHGEQQKNKSNDVAALANVVLGQKANQAISHVVQKLSTCTHLPLYAIEANMHCHLGITLMHQNARVLLSRTGLINYW